MNKKNKKKLKLTKNQRSILNSFKYSDAIIKEDMELLKELAKH